MNEEQLALVKYRLREAEDSIDEARVLMKEGMSMLPFYVLRCFSASSGKTVRHI